MEATVEGQRRRLIAHLFSLQQLPGGEKVQGEKHLRLQDLKNLVWRQI